MEFYAACEGYMDKQKDDIMPLRFASYRVAESMAGTKAIGNIDRFWPIEVKAKSKQPPLTKEQIEDIFKRHNIKVK